MSKTKIELMEKIDLASSKKKKRTLRLPSSDDESETETVNVLGEDKLNDISWDILDKYFVENTHYLVAHHLDTYNDFFDKGIYNIFKENNPIRFIERKEKEQNEIKIYLGGKNGNTSK